jgi:hypothetical protein
MGMVGAAVNRAPGQMLDTAIRADEHSFPNAAIEAPKAEGESRSKFFFEKKNQKTFDCCPRKPERYRCTNR